MRIQTKLSILGFSLALLICIALLLIYRIEQQSVTQFSESERRTEQALAEKVTDYMQKPLATYVKDYSVWDDMAEHVRARDTEWISTNIEGSLDTYDSDTIWIVDPTQAILVTKTREGKDQVTFPLSMQDLFTIPAIDQQHSFFQKQNDHIVRFAISPILYNTQIEKNASASGYIVIARGWDEHSLKDLGELLNAQVQLSDSEDNSSIDISLPLRDQTGSTVSFLRFEFPHTLHTIIENALQTQILFIVIAAIISLLLATYFHIIWVIGPVRKIIGTLENCTNKDLYLAVPKGEEFTQLAALVEAYTRQQQSLIDTKQKLVDELSASTRFSEALHASTEATVITDKNGNILYVNPAWEQLNGYTGAEAIGANPKLLHSGKTSPALYKEMWESLVNGKPFRTEEVINKRKDGSEYHAYLSVFPITDPTGETFYVGIQQDISRRKEVEQMKTDFVSVASHQLRTPLSAIRWFSELLREKLGTLTMPQEREIVDQLYASTLRMIALVNMLLDISRIESGRIRIEPVPTNIQGLLNTVLGDVQQRIENKHLKLTVHIDESIPEVLLDPTMIREVYLNLITNAIKYTPENGSLSIAIHDGADVIQSDVTDSGVGIPLSEQNRIFTKFYRGSNVRSLEADGTGLGLYFIKSIVESSEGKIWFESTPDHGSAFSFTLTKPGMKGQTGTVKVGGHHDENL